jgi:hypothetical protein
MGPCQSCIDATGVGGEVEDIEDLHAHPVGLPSIDKFGTAFNDLLKEIAALLDGIELKREMLGVALNLTKVEPHMQVSIVSLLLSLLATAAGDANKVKPKINFEALTNGDYANAFDIITEGAEFKAKAGEQIDAAKAYIHEVVETVLGKVPSLKDTLNTLLTQGQELISNVASEITSLDIVSFS